jgi:hypothetical protein
MSTFQYAEIVAATTASLLAILTIASKFIWRPMKKNITRDILEMLDERLKPMEAQLTQLSPNGGSSLADKVIRLEERQAGVVSRIDDIYDMVKQLAIRESK